MTAAGLLLAFVVVAPPLQVCVGPAGDPWCAASRLELEGELRAYRVNGTVVLTWEVDGAVLQEREITVRPGTRIPIGLTLDLQSPPRRVTVRAVHRDLSSTDTWAMPSLPPCPYDLEAEPMTMDGARGLVGRVVNRGPYTSSTARVRWFADGRLVSDSRVDVLGPGDEVTLLLQWNEIPRGRHRFLAHASRIGLPLPKDRDPYLGTLVRLEIEPLGNDLDPATDAMEILVPRRWLVGP